MNLVKSECTGCAACIAICPKDALHIAQNEDGFYRPALQTELCLECGLCEKICPLNSEKWKGNNNLLETYACCSRDEETRISSSSGGLFYELAKRILQQKGKVYGCSWISPVCAGHMSVDSEEELGLLTKSKYVQSKIEYTYREIKADLEKEISVLFCGTPCQAAGLRSYLRSNPDNLIIVDFICHGVPSQKSLYLFVDQIEKIYRKKVKGLNFRCKDNGWNVLSLEILFEDASKVVEKAQDNSYYKAFLLNLGLAKSCGECRYNVLPRTSDITLGDFWGISQKYIEKFQDDRGVSCVVINSDKGKNLFDETKDSLVYRKVSVNDILKENPFLNGHCKMHTGTHKYFEELRKGCTDYNALVQGMLKPRTHELVFEIASYQLNKVLRKSYHVIGKTKKKIANKILQRKLNTKDFTIISNNCWSSFTYQKFGLKYRTPTVGLYILGHDFVKFCVDWEGYIHKELEFISWEQSSYYYALKDITPYPVARLGDIEIYFMHYKSESEAREKWNRRVKRINPERMLFKLSQREGCSRSDIERFMTLPLKNKLCFAYDEVPGTIHVPELKDFVGDEYSVISKYIDDISILNEL